MFFETTGCPMAEMARRSRKQADVKLFIIGREFKFFIEIFHLDRMSMAKVALNTKFLRIVGVMPLTFLLFVQQD